MFIPVSTYPKCVTYIRKSTQLQPTLAFAESDCFLGIRLATALCTFTIYNFYSPGRQHAVCHLFHTFLPDQNSIICGDFNSHHTMWYGYRSGQHQRHLSSDSGLADTLVEKIIGLALDLKNTPGEYTHFPRNGSSPSIVDLTLTRGQTSNDVLDWTLGDDFGSDHLSQHIHLSIQQTSPKLMLAWSKTNWATFSATMDSEHLNFGNLNSPQEIERAAENYTRVLNKAIDLAVPKIDTARPRRLRGWWTKELDQISHTVRRLQSEAHEEPGNQDKANIARRARNARRNAIRTAKQSYIMLKLQATTPQDVWQVLRNSRPAHTKAIPSLNNETTFQGKCTALRSSLFPLPTPGSDIPNLQTPEMDLRMEFFRISSQEIQNSLDNCNHRSASGYDRIPYIVLDKAHRHQPSLLSDLLTASITVGYFPLLWKHANCIVVPKGGRRDQSVPKSYRPISLLSNISKVFEKLVARRIANAAIRVKALHSTQFGAIQNRSAIDALFAIVHPATEALCIPNKSKRPRQDRPTFLANDIQGAFNNTDPARLVRIMEARYLPTYLSKWTTSFTAKRTLAFCFDNMVEDPKPYNSGLPQGSPASPVLFLIYAQAMLEAPSNSKEKDVSYLDDDGALQLSPVQSSAITRLEERMALRLARGTQLNLPYDPGKSGLIHFWPVRSNQRPQDVTSQIPITINGVIVTPARTIKHLGVFIDDTLRFHSHADEAASSGYKCLAQLTTLRHHHHGLSTFTALHLVKTALLPKMLWASPVWWTGSIHILNRLEPVYHRALRWASGLPGFLSNRKLYLLTRSPPLPCILDYLSTRYAIRLLFAGHQHPLQQYIKLEGRKVEQSWIEGLQTQTTTMHYPTLKKPLALVARFLSAGEVLEDLYTPGPTPSPQFPVTILKAIAKAGGGPSDNATLHQEYMAKLPQNIVFLYTDGSKLDTHQCGSGWVAYYQNHEIAFGKCNIGLKAEVFDAEIHAIQEGLLSLETSQSQATQILVCADNQAALQTLQSGNPNNSEFARNTLNIIARLVSNGWSIMGLWTPAHCGIPGNERADGLAKAGARTNSKCLHTRTTKFWLQAKSKEEQITQWKARHPTNQLFPIEPSTLFPKNLRPFSPASLRAVFQVMTSSTPTDPYPSNPAEGCNCGGMKTSTHILLACPLFNEARNDLIPSFMDLKDVFNETQLAPLITFLRRIGLGFTGHLLDKFLDGETEVDDLDIGPIGPLLLDLDI